MRDVWLGGLLFTATLMAAMLLLNLFPRNPDNSMKAGIVLPATGLALVVAVLVLRRVRVAPVRYAAWWWAIIGGFGTFFGAIWVLVKLALLA